jgi:streptomycin 6-kinase
MPAVHIPERVRIRALAHGAQGRAWLEGLGEVVAELAAQWALSVGPAMEGGTEALVAPARLADGREAVLKIGMPWLDPSAGERRVLLAAKGRGYAAVLRHDAARGAMLLERLGLRLEELGLPIEAQIEAICATLKEAWRPPPAAEAFMDGAAKARALAEFSVAAWRELGEPCAALTLEMACEFARAREGAFDPARAVLGHGDAHGWNALADPGRPGRFRFVDPDGLFIEPAYDLGISMRSWTTELMAGDAAALGRARCERLAALTGTPPEAIWQWGFMERVSTGLLLGQLGLEKDAQEFLAVADAWSNAGPLAWRG